MNSNVLRLDGLRVLVADADETVAAAVIDMLSGLGALPASASALHDALDALESADPPFDAAVIGRQLADGAPAVLARAIRTSPLLFGLRVVALDDGVAPEGSDTACPWPAPSDVFVAALTGPVAPSASDEPEAPILDLAELESIAGGMTAELARMLRRFADQAHTLAREAMAAAALADAAAAQSRAHALKGAAFSAGAVRLGHAARTFERAAADSDWATAAAIDLAAEARMLAEAIRLLPDPAG